MSRFSTIRRSTLLITALLAVALAGCGGAKDPKQRAIEQRARWSVTLLDWSQSSDGVVTLGTRLVGPPNSDLDGLTVRVQLFDESETEIQRSWHTFDLTDVERGGPVDRIIRIRDLDGEIAGAAIDMVLQPTADDESHIPELNR
jgi:hypothetical protein